jgi:hypothetical protein
VSSPYKLRRRARNFQEGTRSSQKELGTLEVFKPSKFAGENKDLREVTKSDFKSRPLDLEGHMAKDQCIVDSQSGRSRVERRQDSQSPNSRFDHSR